EMANQAQELATMMERFTIREEVSNTVYGTKHKELHLHAAAGNNKVALKARERKSKIDAKNKLQQDDKKDNHKLIDEGFEEF
ncbi:MAG: hypothetical protein ACUVRK_12965, partial [Spirochaetota bacterium]